MRFVFPKGKKLGWALGTIAPLLTAAVAISCGDKAASEVASIPAQASKVVINPPLEALAKVELTGNARIFDVMVPKEVTHVNDKNVFSASGTREAVQVYGMLKFKTAIEINATKMPLRVLRAYLAAQPTRRIEMRGEDFFLVDEETPTGVSLQALYNQTFGFTRMNYAPHWPEVVSPDVVMLAYVSAPGFELAMPALVPVAPTRAALKTYVDVGEENQPLHLELMKWLRTELASASESTPSAVQWYNAETEVKSPTFRPMLSSVQFSTSRSGPWSTTKPASVLAANQVPQLFALLTPQPGYEITPSVLEVTTLLDLVAWRQLVAPPSLFKRDELALVAEDGELVLDTQRAPLPAHTKLEFAYGGKAPWLNLVGLKHSLLTRTLADLRTVQARLAPTDEHYYLLAEDERPFAIDTSTIMALEDNTILKRLLSLIKIDTNRSTGRGNVAWSVVPSLSPVLWQKGVSYLASDLSFGEVKDAMGWTPQLPTSVLGTTQQARIYARAAVQSGVLVRGGVIFDLTESSDFAQLLTLVDLKPLMDFFFRMNINFALSRSEKLVWENHTFTVPPEIGAAVEDVQYLSGDYATAELATAAEGWMRTVPVQTSYNASERYLWVRVLARPGYRFTTALFNITQTSGIRDVRSVFNPTSPLELEQSDLTRINFSAQEGELIIDESAVRLPSGLKIVYYWNNGAGGMSAFDLINHMANVTSFDFTSLRAVVQAVDSQHYVISNNRSAHPNTSRIKGFVDTTSFFNAADRMRVNATTSRSNAQNVYEFAWDNVPQAPAFWGPAATPEYLLGVYPTATAARTASEWSTVVPTTFAATETTPNLWARVRAQDNWVVNTALRDLTLSTGIKDIFAVINVETIINQLRMMRVDLKISTPTNLHWLNIFHDRPRYLAQVQFLYTNVFDEAQDRYSNRWSTSVPFEIGANDPEARVLIARLVPTPGYRLSTTEVNLSITSGLRELGNGTATDRSFATTDEPLNNN